MRRKLKDVLWLALEYAKEQRLSIIDAYGDDKKEETVRSAYSDIKAFEALQVKLFGTSKSRLDSEMEKMTSINIMDLQKLVETNPEIFIQGKDEES